MTTNSEFYDRVLRKARRAGDTTLRSDAQDELEELLLAWERGTFHPWFLEKTSSGLVTIAGTQTVDLPADYLLMVEDTDFFVQDSDGDWQTLERGYHEDLENKYINADSDLPKTYDIFADKFYFGPKPDGAYSLRIKYYAKTTVPPDDNADVSNLWILNAKGFVVASVAHKLVRDYIKDENRASTLQTEANTLRAELHKYNEARKHADMNYEIDR